MTVANLSAALADAEREHGEYTAALADAARALEQSHASFKDDPTTGNGKELVKAEDAHKLAVLAEQGASDRLKDARAALATAERERALAELAALEQASNLTAFEEQIAEQVAKARELRAELASIEQGVLQLASEFTNGRQVEVLARARELGTEAPATLLFEAYARARLDGHPAGGVRAFTVEQRKPRDFAAELLKVSARVADERREAAQKASELEDAQLAKALERDAAHAPS